MNAARLSAVLLLAALVATSCVFVKAAFPDDIPVPAVELPTDEATLERGRYLAHHVTGCVSCHSQRDLSVLSGPVVPGTELAGGIPFDRTRGFPGALYPQNLTPHALSTWTDGELYRAITSGLTRDGTALFPIMPYTTLSKLADDDVRAIIAYLRSVPASPGPWKDGPPERELDGPLGFIVRAMPVPFAGPKTAPVAGDPGYPAYVTNAAACMGCHTQDERGEPIEGLEWAGGRELVLPGFGTVRSSNLTPDDETGIGKWSREMFIARFRAMAPEVVKNVPAAPGSFQTEMPWSAYAGMTETDLGAIYDFLRTVKPVKNEVEKFTPATGTSAAE